MHRVESDTGWREPAGAGLREKKVGGLGGAEGSQGGEVALALKDRLWQLSEELSGLSPSSIVW